MLLESSAVVPVPLGSENLLSLQRSPRQKPNLLSLLPFALGTSSTHFTHWSPATTSQTLSTLLILRGFFSQLPLCSSFISSVVQTLFCYFVSPLPPVPSSPVIIPFPQYCLFPRTLNKPVKQQGKKYIQCLFFLLSLDSPSDKHIFSMRRTVWATQQILNECQKQSGPHLLYLWIYKRCATERTTQNRVTHGIFRACYLQKI